jgi:hypothetical protein
MATATTGYTWASGNTVLPGLLNQMVNSATITLSNDEVTTAKIADANVTDAKLATGIDASKLTTGTLPIARIADDAVTDAKLSLAANAGEVKKALNADNSPPIFACRAWVNFDGTAGSTVDGEFRCTIRSSGNVSKIVRNGAGDYSVFFTTAMPDANYATLVSNRSTFFSGHAFSTTSALADVEGGVATSFVRVAHYPAGDVTGYSGATNDSSIMTVAIFR